MREQKRQTNCESLCTERVGKRSRRRGCGTKEEKATKEVAAWHYNYSKVDTLGFKLGGNKN